MEWVVLTVVAVARNCVCVVDYSGHKLNANDVAINLSIYRDNIDSVTSLLSEKSMKMYRVFTVMAYGFSKMY